MATASYASDPQVQYLVQLLEEVGRGQIQVPRFQRPLVWEPEQQLELLRSVRDGIPMGALMVWRTDKDVECYPTLGAYSLTDPPPAALRQYLLDGVQRLSTLYAATRVPDTAGLDDGDADAISVAYDLEAEEFIFTEPEAELAAGQLPLDRLLDSVKLLKFQRQVPEEQEHWIARSDELARAFREYKIAVIPIVTNDLGMATRTFQRINSQGTEMGELHMIHALSWSPEFSLLERIHSLKEEHLSPIGWDECDDERIILAACKTALGFPIYNTHPDDLSSAIRGKDEIVESAIVALADAAAFLRERCLVPDPKMLPYALQAVVVGEVFRVNESIDEDGLKLLEAWFWLTMYNEFFFGLSSSRLTTTMEYAIQSAQDADPRWPGNRPYARKPLKSKFDFRHARAKGLTLFMASRGPTDPLGEPQDPLQLLAGDPKLAIGRLVPRRMLSRKASYASFGNRVICRAEHLVELREAIANASSPAAVRVSHMVSEEAAACAYAEDWDGFVRERESYIQSEEETFASGWEAVFS
jgi:hypothetical protein